MALEFNDQEIEITNEDLIDTEAVVDDSDDVGQNDESNNADDPERAGSRTKPVNPDADDLIDTSTEEIDDDEEDEKSKPNASGGDKGSSRASSQISSLVKTFADRGIFDLTDDQLEELEAIEDETQREEKFFELMQEGLEQSRYSDLNEEQQKYLKALENGVPEEWYKQNRSNYNIVENVSDEAIRNAEDPDSKTIRYQLIYQDLISKGNTKEDAATMTQTFFDKESDVERAIQAKQNLKTYFDKKRDEEIQKAQAKKNEDSENAQKNLEKLKEVVYKDETIANQKVTPKLKEQMYDALTKPSVKQPDGSMATPIEDLINSKDHAKLKKLAMFYVLTEGFENTKFMERKVRSEQTRKNRENAHDQMSNKGGRTSKIESDTTDKITKSTVAGLRALMGSND